MAGFGYGYYYSTLYWPRSDEDAEWRWKPYLISALPQVEVLRDMYQVWVRLTDEERLRCKHFLQKIMLGSHDKVSDKLLRLTLAIIEAYDEWSNWQDEKGACGCSSELIILSDSFETDITLSLNGLRKAICNRSVTKFSSKPSSSYACTSTIMSRSQHSQCTSTKPQFVASSPVAITEKRKTFDGDGLDSVSPVTTCYYYNKSIQATPPASRPHSPHYDMESDDANLSKFMSRLSIGIGANNTGFGDTNNNSDEVQTVQSSDNSEVIKTPSVYLENRDFLELDDNNYKDLNPANPPGPGLDATQLEIKVDPGLISYTTQSYCATTIEGSDEVEDEEDGSTEESSTSAKDSEETDDEEVNSSERSFTPSPTNSDSPSSEADEEENKENLAPITNFWDEDFNISQQ